jgi:hypothetical protein
MGSAPPIWGSSPRWQKAFSVLGYLIVGASILAQLCLVALFVHTETLGPGEERAFARMAFLALCVASLFVVVPGTLVAIARASLAFRARNTSPNAYLSIVFHSAAALLPVLAIGFVLIGAAVI